MQQENKSTEKQPQSRSNDSYNYWHDDVLSVTDIYFGYVVKYN